MQGWAAQAPPGFCYAVKLGRFGTHRKKLLDPAPWLARHLDRVGGLGEHLGPNLVQLPPRWKRCVSSTDGALGELLAQPYLERMFTPAAKDGADAMVQGITGAFGKVVTNLDWMSDATKEKALGKLATISPMFGYPDKWKSYDWQISADNHAANALDLVLEALGATGVDYLAVGALTHSARVLDIGMHLRGEGEGR